MIRSMFLEALSGNVKGFFGRRCLLQSITEQVLKERNFHISIHGLPHVGKSMLQKKLAEQLNLEENCCAVYQTVDARNGFVMVLRKFISKGLRKQLEQSLSAPALAEYNAMIQGFKPQTEREALDMLRGVLSWTTCQGVRVIWLLDEFELIVGDDLLEEKDDSLKNWSEKEYLGFAEVLLDESLNFTCITASRPGMEDILEAYRIKINPFFSQLLRGFDEEDIRTYFSLLARGGYVPEFDEQQRIMRYCGRNPRLLTYMGVKILEMSSWMTVRSLYKQEQKEFQNRFDDTTRHMKYKEERKKRNFSHVVKCYFGPSSDNWDVLERCVDMGYIDLLEEKSPYTYQNGDFYYVDQNGKYGEKNKRYVYVTVSHLFVDYLYTDELENITDTRDLLTGFIYTLRDVTKRELKDISDNWNEKLLFNMEGWNSKFIMKSAVYNRYIMWFKKGTEWICSESEVAEEAIAERERYFLQFNRQNHICYISDPSFKFLLKSFNSELAQTDMPVLDVINVTENGRIMYHFKEKFRFYFGCFGSGFIEAGEENPFLLCLKELQEARNSIAHFSRTGLREEKAERIRFLCKKLISSMYTYISTGQPAEADSVFI